MNNTDELLKRILLNMRYDSKMTLKENVSLVSNLLTEGWEKFPCVGYHPNSKKVKLTDGSYGYMVDEDLYYSNGRVKKNNTIESFNCNTGIWPLITKHYQKSKQGDYNTKTWGDQNLQSTASTGKYVVNGKNPFDKNQYILGELNDGMDYINWCGWSDGSCHWIAIPQKFRNTPVDSSGKNWKDYIDWIIGLFGDNLKQDNASVKSLTNFLLKNWDSELGTIDNNTWSPWAIAIMNKINAIGNHQSNVNKELQAYGLAKKEALTSVDENKVLQVGMKDPKVSSTTQFISKPSSVNIEAFQTLLNNVALSQGKPTINVNGNFNDETLKLLRDLFKKDSISIKELKELTKQKYGTDIVGPYQGYWSTVNELRGKGFKYWNCYYTGTAGVDAKPQCKTKDEHLNQSAWLEMIGINQFLANGKINLSLDCQLISALDKGISNTINDYGVNTAKSLVSNRQFLTDNSSMPKIMPKFNKSDIDGISNLKPEEFMLVATYKEMTKGGKKLTQEEMSMINPQNKDINKLSGYVSLYENMTTSMSRPYFTYFILRDFYFGASNKFMWNNTSLFPQGAYNFMSNYYGTSSSSEIYQSINTYSPEMFVTSCNDVLKPSNRITNEGIHTTLGMGELGLVALSFLPTPLSPLFFVASTVVGLTDSILYFAEGDKWMGLMVLGFSLLNVGELSVIFKESSAYAKVASSYKMEPKAACELLAKRYTAGEALQEWEKQAIKDLKGVFKGSSSGSKLVETKYSQEIIKNLKNAKLVFSRSKMGSKDFWTLVCGYAKAGKFNILKTTLTLFGTPITLDVLYRSLYGNDDDRKNSPLFQVYLKTKGFIYDQFRTKSPSEQKKELDQFFNDLNNEATLDKLLEAMQKFSQDLTLKMSEIKTMMSVNSIDPNIFNFGQKPNTDTYEELTFQTPSIYDIENNNRRLLVGMSGDSVKEIQKLLKDKWKYDLGDSGIDKNGIDGVYDERMYNTIKKFQGNIITSGKEPMDISGEVDSLTFSYLKNTKPEDMKISIKKPLPLVSSNIPEENLQYLYKPIKYYYFSPFNKQWKEIPTKEEYQSKQNSGVQLKTEIGNWVETNKGEFIKYNNQGYEVMISEKPSDIIRPNQEINNKKSRFKSLRN